jgi:hypothetical protein
MDKGRNRLRKTALEGGRFTLTAGASARIGIAELTPSVALELMRPNVVAAMNDWNRVPPQGKMGLS